MAWNEQECKDRFKMLIEFGERAKSNTHRIDELEQTTRILHDMNTNIAILAEQTKEHGKELIIIKNDVEDIKAKPSKRWDLVITVIITACITGLVSYIIMALLTGGK